jgi:hypothetical protein
VGKGAAVTESVEAATAAMVVVVIAMAAVAVEKIYLRSPGLFPPESPE